MTRIINLGNGYGRIEGYTSKYASRTFPLNLSGLRILYGDGYISKDEFIEALLSIRYSEKAAVRTATCASVPIKQ